MFYILYTTVAQLRATCPEHQVPCHTQSLSRVLLFATLRTVAHQAPLPMEFMRPEYWSRLPLPPPGGLPDPEIELMSSGSPALQMDCLPLRKPILPQAPRGAPKLSRVFENHCRKVTRVFPSICRCLEYVLFHNPGLLSQYVH